MKNPHIEPFEASCAEARQTLATAQTRLAKAEENLRDATPEPVAPQERRAALDAVCAALNSPASLTLGLLLFAPLHASGLWLVLRTRRLMRIAQEDNTPPLDHLPRKSDADSIAPFFASLFVIGLLGALATLVWCQAAHVEKLWFVSFSQAYFFLDSFGLPAATATTITSTALGVVLLALVVSFLGGLFEGSVDDGETALFAGAIIAALSFLLVMVLALTLGGLLAEHHVGLWLFAVPVLVHALVYLKAAINRTTLNAARLRREFEVWVKADQEKGDEHLAELQAKVAAAEATCRTAREQAEQAQAAYDAESARWSALSRVEQLQEVQLLKNIEATQAQINTQWLTAEAAQREANAAEYTARRQAAADAQASRFAAQKAAQEASDRRAAEKAARESARPVCRYCGTVEPRMPGGSCPASPTGHHVLLR